MGKLIKSVGSKGKKTAGLSFKKKPTAFDLKVEKGDRTLAPSEATKKKAIALVAEGVSQRVAAAELAIRPEEISRLIRAKNRKRIGETEGAIILREFLLENAIIAGEVVREKVTDLGAKDAAIVMGISTSNYLAMKAKTESEQKVVTPREIATLASEIGKYKQLSQGAPL